MSLGLGGWHNPSPAMELAREMWEAEARRKRHAELAAEVTAESRAFLEGWDAMDE